MRHLNKCRKVWANTGQKGFMMWVSKLILVQLLWQIEEGHFNSVTWLIHFHYLVLDKLICITLGSHILTIQSIKA